MNPATHNKMRSKHLSEFFKGINGTCTQTVKPLHRHQPQARWEYLAHQGLVLGVHSHSLIEVANMLHRIYSTIIHGERGLSEPPRKSSSFNPVRERWFGNLVECPAHSIISQASQRWISASTLMMVVLIIRERFTMRGPWSAPIATILFLVGREVRFGRSSLSPFVA